MMQFDRDFMLACGLDRMIQLDFMTIDFITELILESSNDVLRCDRTESFAGLARLEREYDSQLTDSTAEFFRFVQLAGVTS